MSSSIEEQFQPPEWATKDEVIKAAQHYINYWKIEARHRNQQWLDALSDNARLKAEVGRLTKAGDKMAHMHRFFGFPSYTLEWEAAKEGKQ